VRVCCRPCSYNCAAVDKILIDMACRAVCLQLKSYLVTVGTEEMYRRPDSSFFGCHQSRSFHVIHVCFLSSVFRIFKTLSGKTNAMTYCTTLLPMERATGIIINNSGKFEDLVLMIARRQTYRHRDRDIIQTCYSMVFLTTSVLEAI